MSLPKCLDFSNYNRYPSDENPTTDDDIQTFLENQNHLMQVLVSRLWQPETQLVVGQVIYSPSMKSGLVAVVVTAGKTGTSEPTWGTDGSSVTDSGASYVMRKSVIAPATNEQAEAGESTETYITPASMKTAVTDWAPVYNSAGHVVLKDGSEFWIE